MTNKLALINVCSVSTINVNMVNTVRNKHMDISMLNTIYREIISGQVLIQ